MGATVGASVGAAVGASVGASVGRAVGASVGASVSASVVVVGASVDSLAEQVPGLPASSHTLSMSFHSRGGVAGAQGLTTGVPVLLSAFTVHWR